MYKILRREIPLQNSSASIMRYTKAESVSSQWRHHTYKCRACSVSSTTLWEQTVRGSYTDQ